MYPSPVPALTKSDKIRELKLERERLLIRLEEVANALDILEAGKE